MNFAEIEKTINGLAKKASDGTISIDEMAGGSFTISNGGVYGSLLSAPIINPPQVSGYNLNICTCLSMYEGRIHLWLIHIGRGVCAHSSHSSVSLIFNFCLRPERESHMIKQFFWQSAIMCMHSIVSRPMVVGGNVVPRPMMYISTLPLLMTIGWLMEERLFSSC